MRKPLTFGLMAGLIASSLVLLAPAAQANSLDAACADVEAVWARGSGQNVEIAEEGRRFRNQLNARIPAASLSVHHYELGADKTSGGYGGSSYEAVDVSPWNGNLGGARFSGGFGFDYGRSVDGGVGELYNYLRQRQAKCLGAGSRFVLGGYSQGAQVVGQTLEKMSVENAALLTGIDFAAMFGDPKLYLPEGEGLFPAACRGQNFSSWRRTVPDCDTDSGSLGARKPYVATALSTKAGLWCGNSDFVCGSSPNPFSNAGHFKYFNEAGAIDEAVQEMADRLAKSMPPAKAAGLKRGALVIGAGTTGLDVAFVIDTTGSMGDDIEEARLFARTAAASINEQRGRVALIAYRDVGDEYTARVFTGLNGDLSEFQLQLDSLTADGGGDTPEALLHGLMTTLNGLDWRPGATKAAVVLTDADYHAPDLVDGTTVEQVAARALEIDPVNVYPVVPDFLTAQYQELADLTSGQVITNGGDTAASLTTALNKIRNRPVPLLPLTDYYGKPGDTFTFDASKSYVAESTITGYEWDFDGDGTFEQGTSTPIATHQYASDFDGSMQVRVTAADGGVANASAFVHVGSEGPGGSAPAAPRDLRADVLTTVGGVSTVRLTWNPSDSLAERWGITVNGVSVGRTDPGVTSVELSDIQRSGDVLLGVAGLTAANVVGSAAAVTVPRETVAPPVSNKADLRTVVAGPASARAGTLATYTVKVTNTGPSTASNVNVVLGAANLIGLTAAPITASGSIKVADRVVSGARWATPSLAAGQTLTFSIRGKVPARVGQTFTAVGAAVSPTPDPVILNNIGAVSTRITR